MEVQIQDRSPGIVYEGYTNKYTECFHEDTVAGVHERYEFRCAEGLACCERHCCIIEEATVPFWLMIIFIALAALLFLLALATLAWCWSKRPRPPAKPKKVASEEFRKDASRSGQSYTKSSAYEPIPTDDPLNTLAVKSAEEASFRSKNAHEHFNPLYTPKDATHGTYRSELHSDQGSEVDTQNTVIERTGTSPEYRSEVVIPIKPAGAVRQQGFSDEEMGYDGRSTDDDWLGSRGAGKGFPDRARGGYYSEKFEETFQEKYEVEEEPNRYPEKFIPSPMEEQLLKPPDVKRVVKHSEEEISTPVQAETIEPPPLKSQRAQIAYYRSQTDQVPSYNPVD